MSPAEDAAGRTDPQLVRETYTHGYGKRIVQNMAGRDAAGSLGFLLPHLRPGMRVLDCGCGPGAITADVAELTIVHYSQPAFVQTVLEQGWADEATLAATHEAVRSWGEHPDAFRAIVVCEAIGWVDADDASGA